MRTRVFGLLKALEMSGPQPREALRADLWDLAAPGWESMAASEAVACGDALEKDGVVHLTEKGRRALAAERRRGKRCTQLPAEVE